MSWQLTDLSNRLILASASPRRKELLLQAGIKCQIIASNINEETLVNESAHDMVLRLARDKALALLKTPLMDLAEEFYILGADTSVVIDKQILGKPESKDSARKMLELLSSNKHQVLTGMALVSNAGSPLYSTVSESTVEFIKMTTKQIDNYIESGEPMDKAGAYAIQGLGAKFIKNIEGSYTGIVGLDISVISEWFANVGLINE